MKLNSTNLFHFRTATVGNEFWKSEPESMFASPQLRKIFKVKPEAAKKLETMAKKVEPLVGKNKALKDQFDYYLSDKYGRSYKDEDAQKLIEHTEHALEQLERYSNMFKLIKSDVFSKYLVSIGHRSDDQDYDRFMGLLELINKNPLPENKKLWNEVLSVDYLKDTERSKIRSKIHNDLFSMYENIKAKRNK